MIALNNKKVWVAGADGMVGQAVVRRLQTEACAILATNRRAVDLTDQNATRHWIQTQQPDMIILAAARVGGILANATYPAQFIYENLQIQNNVIHAAHEHGIERLLFLGSSCIYPRLAPQPIPESALLSGPLEDTNQWYALAKIAGIKMCQAYRQQYGRAYIAAMPTNLYGPGDTYHLEHSHVIPALIMKIHNAKIHRLPTVTVWGSGQARREFLFVNDLADALVFLLQNYNGEEIINVGTGIDLTIAELAEKIARVVDYPGTFVYDATKPDGTPRKLLDVTHLTALGWVASTSLEDGLHHAYHAFLRQHEAAA